MMSCFVSMGASSGPVSRLKIVSFVYSLCVGLIFAVGLTSLTRLRFSFGLFYLGLRSAR
jgi:hypothetical protein